MKLDELQENWNKFGETDPLWGILAWPDKTENRWQVDAFFATGVEEIDAVWAYAEGLGLEIEFGTALDFGCGVGRLSQALARRFELVHGVDISPAMIELAQEYNQFGEHCRYHLNPTADLSLFEDQTIDFIYSNITLQHMPPRYARSYIQEFLAWAGACAGRRADLPNSPRAEECGSASDPTAEAHRHVAFLPEMALWRSAGDEHVRHTQNTSRTTSENAWRSAR